MKIDVSRKLVGFDGEVLWQNVQKRNKEGVLEMTQEEMILRLVFENALLLEMPQRPVSPTKKVSRMELARRIHRARKDVMLSVDEAAELKELVLEMYPPLVAGLTANILDGKEDKELEEIGKETEEGTRVEGKT